MYSRTLFSGIRTNVDRLLHTENVPLLVVRLYTKSEERARLYHWFIIIIIIIIIIISHASIGADIKKKKKRKESKQEQARPVADWTLSLRQPRAYGLLDQPLDCSQSEMEKKRLLTG